MEDQRRIFVAISDNDSFVGKEAAGMGCAWM